MKILKCQQVGRTKELESIISFLIISEGKEERKEMTPTECQAFMAQNNATMISAMTYYRKNKTAA